MIAPKLRIVTETREQRIERALQAMGEVVIDLSLPLEVRRSIWRGYAALHTCRAPETVSRMERDKRLR